jgi:hypothetical protein
MTAPAKEHAEQRQHRLGQAIEVVAAIGAARRLGILDLLNHTPCDADAVARCLG